MVQPEEFEKDNDQNFHIDLIYSMANNRAANYKLNHMDWITGYFIFYILIKLIFF